MASRQLIVGTLRALAVINMIVGGLGIVLSVIVIPTNTWAIVKTYSAVARPAVVNVTIFVPLACAVLDLPRAILLWLSGTALLYGKRTATKLLFACALYTIVSCPLATAMMGIGGFLSQPLWLSLTLETVLPVAYALFIFALLASSTARAEMTPTASVEAATVRAETPESGT